ncbi:hypothetical protein D3C83_137830 [compost metagenome]
MRPVGLRASICANMSGLFRRTLSHTPPAKNTLPGETMLARIFLAARLRASPLM